MLPSFEFALLLGRVEVDGYLELRRRQLPSGIRCNSKNCLLNASRGRPGLATVVDVAAAGGVRAQAEGDDAVARLGVWRAELGGCCARWSAALSPTPPKPGEKKVASMWLIRLALHFFSVDTASSLSSYCYSSCLISPKKSSRRPLLDSSACVSRAAVTEELVRQVLNSIHETAGGTNLALSLGYVGTQGSSYPINAVFLWSSGPHQAIINVGLCIQRVIGVCN